jgi:hypothetical protein
LLANQPRACETDSHARLSLPRTLKKLTTGH